MTDAVAYAEAELDAHRLAAAAAVRRLGHALTAGNIDVALAAQVTDVLNELADQAERAPRRDKQHEHAKNSSRFAALVEGRAPDPMPDGQPIEFDRFSVVGGELNPFGLVARHHRDGEDAVSTVSFGPAFEGPPGRVHGGAIALVIDEATATVLAMTGHFGFTGSVSLRLIAPAPLGVELEFRSRLTGEEGRKLFVRCEGIGPEGTFAVADAIYVQVDPGKIPWIAAARAARELPEPS